MPGAGRRKRTPGGIHRMLQEAKPHAAPVSAAAEASEPDDARKRPTSRPPRSDSFQVVPNPRARLDGT